MPIPGALSGTFTEAAAPGGMSAATMPTPPCESTVFAPCSMRYDTPVPAGMLVLPLFMTLTATFSVPPGNEAFGRFVSR